MNSESDINMTTSTLDKILICAKEEFLKKGFKNASLRNIAKSSNVTTGAIYGYFKDKDAIFVALVDKFLKGLNDLIEEIESNDRKKILSGEKQINDNIDDMLKSHRRYIQYIYDNIEEAKLIFLCADGSSLENCIENIIKNIGSENLSMLEKIDISTKIDEFTIHILVEFYFTSVVKFIKNDVSYEKALEQMGYINKFLFGGFRYIIETERIELL